MQKIAPFLWFEDKAEEAANFYVSIFKNSKIKEVARYDEESAAVSGRPVGSVMVVSFEIEGQEFNALNGGPEFSFSPAISFYIKCDTQEEIDHFWSKFSEGGKIMACGWITDKFGVTWQVSTPMLDKMLQDKDPAKARRVMKAMLGMEKIDIEGLKKAYNQ